MKIGWCAFAKTQKVGKICAAMPLHDINAKVERVVFETQKSEVQLLGKDVNYVYRVPPQLLTLQGE